MLNDKIMVTYWVSIISMRGDFDQAEVHKIQAQNHTYTRPNISVKFALKFLRYQQTDQILEVRRCYAYDCKLKLRV
jgi:hypothetical protein